MQYSIGEKVSYNDKIYTICGAHEKTNLNIEYSKDNSKNEVKTASLEITYDLEDNNGEIITNINEYELDCYDDEDLLNYDFKENVEYVLKNGLIVQYCSICDALETEDGIEIPVDLYNSSGKCLSCNDFDVVGKTCNDFDVVEQKSSNNTSSCDDNKDKKDDKEITLSSDDGKYSLKVFNKPYGIGIMGELPENMRSALESAINLIKDGLND